MNKVIIGERELFEVLQVLRNHTVMCGFFFDHLCGTVWPDQLGVLAAVALYQRTEAF